MGPLACKAAVTKVVAVVGSVDDDGVIREALLLKLFYQTPNHVVDATDHAEVGAHVRLVLVRRVPSPEEALPIDRFLKELRMRLVDRRIIQWR